MAKAIGIFLLVQIAILLLPSCSKSTVSLEEERKNMIERQFRRRGIRDQTILNAFEVVPREAFVLPKYRDRAYDDAETPTAFGQTLDRPFENALMVQALGIKPTDKILEVGTGSGYLAAIMSKIGNKVYTIEIEPEIASDARTRIKELRYDNIEVRTGDGFAGWPENAPFDIIVLACSPPKIPKPLEEQLAEGGRMLIPLGGSEQFQELILYKKVDGKLKDIRRLAPTTFVPMKGKILKEKTRGE